MKYLFSIILLFCIFFTEGQVADSLPLKDSVSTLSKPSSKNDIIFENNNLNLKGIPISYEIRKRSYKEDDFNFYILLPVVFFFSLIRAIFPRYFTNIFRVFFNSSLQQSQLTDQLVQAKLPSLFYNIFFSFSFSIYVFFLFQYLKIIPAQNRAYQLLYIFIVIILIYIFKWLIIKFIGWISNYEKLADKYLFIVFLLNKVLSICLLPLTIVLTFSNNIFAEVSVVISYVLILIFLALRYLKMYESLSSRIQLNKFHFFIFLFAIEILPIILISKTSVYLLAK